MKARKLLVALLTPVLALTVASCGGKGDSTTSSSQAPATSSNANPASSTTSITNNVETITISVHSPQLLELKLQLMQGF